MFSPSKVLDRIEKSDFHRGEYVGYAGGLWTIRRASYGWFARHRDDPRRALVTARTLVELNAKLGEARVVRVTLIDTIEEKLAKDRRTAAKETV